MSADLPDDLIDKIDERKPFRVRCGKCSHKWIAAYTPMQMGPMAKVLKAIRCPMCAETARNIFVLTGEK